MAQLIFTIKDRPTFEMIKKKGLFIKSQNLNMQVLLNQNLNKSIGIGFTATKRIGNAIKRNKAKRIMRELSKKIIINGKINSYYVLIAKPSLLSTPFEKLIIELKTKIDEI